MTIEDATTILEDMDAIDDGPRLDTPADEPGAPSWVCWEPGRSQRCATLGGYDYTADQLEAIAVWMRHYQEAR